MKIIIFLTLFPFTFFCCVVLFVLKTNPPPSGRCVCGSLCGQVQWDRRWFSDQSLH